MQTVVLFFCKFHRNTVFCTLPENCYLLTVFSIHIFANSRARERQYSILCFWSIHSRNLSHLFTDLQHFVGGRHALKSKSRINSDQSFFLHQTHNNFTHTTVALRVPYSPHRTIIRRVFFVNINLETGNKHAIRHQHDSMPQHFCSLIFLEFRNFSPK